MGAKQVSIQELEIYANIVYLEKLRFTLRNFLTYAKLNFATQSCGQRPRESTETFIQRLCALEMGVLVSFTEERRYKPT